MSFLFIFVIFCFLFCLVDIDECSNSTMNDCHVNATCTNTDGSFTCACKPGYTGNGTDCTGKL